VSTVHDMNA